MQFDLGMNLQYYFQQMFTLPWEKYFPNIFVYPNH